MIFTDEALASVIKVELDKIKEIINEDITCKVTAKGTVTVDASIGVNVDKKRVDQVAIDRYGPLMTIASFKLTQMPGNCGIIVSHSTYVDYTYRKKGIATIFQTMKEKLAQYTNYTVMYATTVISNEYEIKVLEKSGWVKAPNSFLFTNRRTSNEVTMWLKIVPKVETKITPIVQEAA
jgi:hypothetical protein